MLQIKRTNSGQNTLKYPDDFLLTESLESPERDVTCLSYVRIEYSTSLSIGERLYDIARETIVHKYPVFVHNVPERLLVHILFVHLAGKYAHVVIVFSIEVKGHVLRVHNDSFRHQGELENLGQRLILAFLKVHELGNDALLIERNCLFGKVLEKMLEVGGCDD